MRHTFPRRHRTFPPLAQPRALLVFCPPIEQNRTVFFWAPVAKWGLVAAGIKDLQRPADKLSLTQNLALAATGFIWVSVVVEVEMAGGAVCLPHTRHRICLQRARSSAVCVCCVMGRRS